MSTKKIVLLFKNSRAYKQPSFPGQARNSSSSSTMNRGCQSSSTSTIGTNFRRFSPMVGMVLQLRSSVLRHGISSKDCRRCIEKTRATRQNSEVGRDQPKTKQNQTKRSESGRDHHKIQKTIENREHGRDQPKTVQNLIPGSERSRDQHKTHETTQNGETGRDQPKINTKPNKTQGEQPRPAQNA